MDVFTAISLCTGYDGIGLGLRRAIANLRTVAYVERECYAVANLVAKIQAGLLDDAPIWDDVSTFDGRPFAGLVGIIHAGVPCQPWSLAGKREGTKDERWIWGDIFRIIVEVQPEYVFLEEVPGFISGGGLGFVLSDLAQAGFDAEWGCFTAAECGAPHKRKRLFILAHKHGCRLAGHEPETTTEQNCHEPQDGISGPDGAVADAECPESRPRDGQESPAGERWDRPAIGGKEVADAECPERRPLQQYDELPRRWQQAAGGLGGEGEELADTSRTELSGRQGQPGNDGLQLAPITGGCDKWPAGCGQPQYEWEEPRVVYDFMRGGLSKRKKLDSDQVQDTPDRDSRREHSDGSSSAKAVASREVPRRRRQEPQRGAQGRTAVGRAREGQVEPGVGLQFDESAGRLGHYNNQSIRGRMNENKKARAREILLAMWRTTPQEDVPREAGGLWGVLEAEILRAGLCYSDLPERIRYACWFKESGTKIPRATVRFLWDDGKAERSPQGSEPREQFRRELAYAMLQLSYEMALGAWENDAPSHNDLFRLWDALRTPHAWHVSEALPALEEIRRSLDDGEDRGAFVQAVSRYYGRQDCRVDELRLLGNGVVPAQAEKGFRYLFAYHRQLRLFGPIR